MGKGSDQSPFGLGERTCHCYWLVGLVALVIGDRIVALIGEDE